MNQLVVDDYPMDGPMLDLFREWIPMPPEAVEAGLDEGAFYGCLECYPEYTALIDFDSLGFAAAIDEQIVEPLRRAEALYEHRFMTRMTSSLDAAEMTVDPTFTANPELGSVDNVRVATLWYLCGAKAYTRDGAPRLLELPDGTEIRVPSENWFDQHDVADDDFWSTLDDIGSLRIERTRSTGAPEVLTDNADRIQALIDAHNALYGPTPPGACTGCSAAGSGSAGGLAWLAALIGVRRRSPRPSPRAPTEADRRTP